MTLPKLLRQYLQLHRTDNVPCKTLKPPPRRVRSKFCAWKHVPGHVILHAVLNVLDASPALMMPSDKPVSLPVAIGHDYLVAILLGRLLMLSLEYLPLIRLLPRDDCPSHAPVYICLTPVGLSPTASPPIRDRSPSSHPS